MILETSYTVIKTVYLPLSDIRQNIQNISNYPIILSLYHRYQPIVLSFLSNISTYSGTKENKRNDPRPRCIVGTRGLDSLVVLYK